MAINIRRVVTGHNANGKAVVGGRPQMSRELIWTTNDVPVHFTEDGEDKGVREISTTITNGSVFRVVEYEPGATPRNQLHASTCSERSIGRRLPMDILVARNSLGKPQTVS